MASLTHVAIKHNKTAGTKVCGHLMSDKKTKSGSLLYKKCRDGRCKHKCCRKYFEENRDNNNNNVGDNNNNEDNDNADKVRPAISPKGLARAISLEYAENLSMKRENARDLLDTNPKLRTWGMDGLEIFKLAYGMKKKEEKEVRNNCVRCHKAPATVEYFPCLHIIHCEDCSRDYFEKYGVKKCQSCGTELQERKFFDPHLTECDVCYGEWPNEYMIPPCGDECEHLICVGCMVFSFRMALKDMSIFTRGGIKCPKYMDCKKITNPASFNQLVDLANNVLPDPEKRTDQTPFTDEEKKKYNRFSEESRIPTNQRITCENPDCAGKFEDGEPFVQDVGEGKGMKKFKCLYCNSEQYAKCYKCKGKWHPGKYCPDEKEDLSMAVIKASSKPCPNCQYPTSRYHSHGCHHIRPGSGCRSCGHHWCYVCSGVYRNCGCSYQGASSCDTVHSKDDIEYNDLGWPVSKTCKCPICPDCRVGKSCKDCYGDCPVCEGIVPPAEIKCSGHQSIYYRPLCAVIL